MEENENGIEKLQQVNVESNAVQTEKKATTTRKPVVKKVIEVEKKPIQTQRRPTRVRKPIEKVPPSIEVIAEVVGEESNQEIIKNENLNDQDSKKINKIKSKKLKKMRKK